jgi:hypothetical protein
MKQQFMGSYVASLRHIILIPRQPVFIRTHWRCKVLLYIYVFFKKKNIYNCGDFKATYYFSWHKQSIWVIRANLTNIYYV